MFGLMKALLPTVCCHCLTVVIVFALPGAQEEIDYSAKLKFSDDEGEEEGEEEETESNSDARYVTK